MPIKLIEKKQHFMQSILSVAKGIDLSTDWYISRYPYFVDYFNRLEEIQLRNIIIGISFTYSWMPTILKSLKTEHSDRIISILNQVKKGEKINVDQISILKETFNNSLVGTTKLLHFISPKNYAIWDSNVYKALYDSKPYKYRLDSIEKYFEYLELIDGLKYETDFEKFYSLMTKAVGYEITESRAIELALFKSRSK